MATYTPSLRFTRPANGDLNWGDTVNNGFTTLADNAIAGTATINFTGTSYTLSQNNGVTDESRSMFLVCTGTPGGAATLICPAVSKLYVVTNNTTGGYAVTLKTFAGTGIAVPNGYTVVLRCDGTNVVTAGVDDTAIPFTQAGTGAVTRTVQSKLRDVVSVKDFGAVGDGVTDDSAAIQTAVNSLTNGGTLVFPFGTYKVNTSIEIQKSNVTIIGNNSSIDATALSYNAAVRGSGAVFRFTSPNSSYTTTLSATSLAGSNTLTLTSATGAVAGQLIRCISDQVQYRNDTAIAYFNDQNKIVDVSGTTIKLESSLQYDLTVSPYVVSVSYRMPISHLTVQDLLFYGGGVRQDPLGNGLGPCGVWAAWAEHLTVKNCKFYGFQGIAVGADGVRDFVVSDCYFEGIDANTVIVEGQNSSFYAAYALRARRVLFTRCVGQRVRHIFDAAEAYQVTQSDSIASNTHRGAFGSHEEVYDLNVVGNTSYNCYSGFVGRALTANVTGNTFTAGKTNDLGITTAVMLNTDVGRARYIIADNRFYSMGSGTGAISLSLCSDQLTISSNLIVGANPVIRFNGDDKEFVNVIVTDNNFLFESPGIASAINVLSTSGVTGSFKNILISDNISNGQTANVISISGGADVTNPADYIKIVNNVGIAAPAGALNAILLDDKGYYGDSIVIRGNTQWNDVSAAVSICQGQTYRIRSYPIVELNDETNRNNMGNRTVAVGSSSSPTVLNDATLLDQSVIESTAAAAGSTNYWVVTTSGTNGTITGVTGAITAGSNLLTLTGNDQTKVYSGSYITIAGAGLGRVRVVSIDATFTNAVISTNSVNTVTGAAINRAAPIIAAGANLV